MQSLAHFEELLQEQSQLRSESARLLGQLNQQQAERARLECQEARCQYEVGIAAEEASNYESQLHAALSAQSAQHTLEMCEVLKRAEVAEEARSNLEQQLAVYEAAAGSWPAAKAKVKTEADTASLKVSDAEMDMEQETSREAVQEAECTERERDEPKEHEVDQQEISTELRIESTKMENGPLESSYEASALELRTAAIDAAVEEERRATSKRVKNLMSEVFFETTRQLDELCSDSGLVPHDKVIESLRHVIKSATLHMLTQT
mmetsp:Transcript_22743/g.37645  ORF Transcript_22743/g.37645 Transcript_22743/m.37645 type:complete len:263 (+) Transcript_22743:150-938(+)